MQKTNLFFLIFFDRVDDADEMMFYTFTLFLCHFIRENVETLTSSVHFRF